MPSASNKQSVASLGGITGVMPAAKAYWSTMTPHGETGALTGLDLGIAQTTHAPTLAVEGTSSMAGNYTYYVVQYDQTRDRMGNPHATGVAINGVSGTGVRVTFADTPSNRATHRRIYRNKAGGSVFYKVGETAIANTYFDDTMADSSLVVGLGLLELDNNVPPTGGRGLFTHGMRGFCFKGSSLFGTKAGTLDAWPPLYELVIARYDRKSGEIKAAKPFGGDILIAKERGLHLLTYQLDPFDTYDSWVEPLQSERGCLNEYCLVDAGGVLVGMDHEAIWVYAGGMNTLRIDTDIRQVLAWRNMDLASWFCAEASSDCVRFFLAMKGDGSTVENPALHWVLKLDLASIQPGQRPQWWLEYYDHPIRHCDGFAPGGANAKLPVTMSALGKTAALGILTSDGVPSGYGAMGDVLDAEVNSGDTRIYMTETVPGGGFFGDYDLTDLYARFVDTEGGVSRPYRILGGAEGDPGYFLVEGEVDPLPEEWPEEEGATGWRFMIGAIDAEYRTPVFESPDPSDRLHVAGVDVRYRPVPRARGKLHVRVIRDRMGEMPAGMTVDDGRLAGVNGAPAIEVVIGGSPRTEGGKGAIRIPAGSSGATCAQLVLSVCAPDTPAEVSMIEFIPEA